ncbi:hypothetical protein IAQ61_008959 [Plenodomus lingam]|uniref:Predicted protein n=1 Tax=Leptosphaeria maculans (strain JN3 / isolate v23.1.3 / race Av1-4-5-6-7-8) TaxID=985895 RepID=E4ZPL6_LEPMJ|nr:predicted protein [Plenodomus lingam JN3]KAH9865013.1 hypothetical protein IAQ61_008959 [Plenodomus lingam]CBX93241.1 predicted protein [Plenodomus lingam JN3]
MRLFRIALAGLATLAVAASNAPSNQKDTITDLVPPFINDPDAVITYHCNKAEPTIIEERTNSGDLTDVTTVFNCPRGDCYQFNTGATCRESTINVKARSPIAQENKHYVCSKDRASVLICRYGFCSTDYYCNIKGSGSYCHDDCICCKKGNRKAADSDKSDGFELSTSAASSPETLEYKLDPQKLAARTNSPGAAEVMQSCPKQGLYMCNLSLEAVFVCNAIYQWQLSADCRPGKCVDNFDAGTAFCQGKHEPRNSARDIEQTSGTLTMTENPEAAEPLKDVISSGRPGSCVDELSAGTTHCITKKSTSAPEAGAVIAQQQHCDKPGAYRCDISGQKIGVCSPSNDWILSSDCSPGHCVDGPIDTAYCTARID